MKKLTVLFAVCSVAAILLSGCGRGSASGGSSTSTGSGGSKESPLLADKVAKGELPPLEQRLPEEPFVSSAEEIGKYGGIYRGGSFGPAHGQVDTAGLRYTGLLRVETDFSTLTPFILKSYTANDDFTVWTLTLRKGMKWSDGAPFTSDAFKFWYEDVLLNSDVTPAVVDAWMSDGKVMTLETPDEVTVKVTFSAPYPSFDIVMMQSCETGRKMWEPRHYLEKWHKKYNAQADDLAKSEGYESWVQAFNQHKDKTDAQTDVNTPDITPWVLSQVDAQGNKYFDRNPYYFVVDKAGNQLPYIDQQIGVIVADAQVRTLKLASGELHAAAENPLPVKDYTLYVQGEQTGDYTTYLFDNSRGSDCSFTFNITHKDPVLRQIFNNVKFREAMSLAINRQQVNDVLYFGKAAIRQAVPPSTTSFMEDWMNDYMAQYDVAGANQRLDEIGLRWNADHTQRLRPDGRPLQIVLESTEEFTPMGEMVAEMWTAVGVKTDYKQNERTFARERYQTNERDAQLFTFDGAAEFALRADPSKIRPAFVRDELGFATQYRQWYDTNGAQGEEPPQELKDLRALVDEWIVLSPSNPLYMEKGKEMLTIFTKNVWYIGLTVAPRVVMISNKLGNIPKEGTFAYDYRFWYPFRGDAWYFK
ncbi:MAG: ABC transporter substrate-binding protein [Treponema sp.]|jgi:peptide/nickel transport system substrate-binding protein|nr:ABC transporter substrate-binding protein [Treponema sp.]